MRYGSVPAYFHQINYKSTESESLKRRHSNNLEQDIVREIVSNLGLYPNT